MRYARSTCSSIQNPASFFELKKKGKFLDSEDYAACLQAFFDSSNSLTKLTMPDLQNVLLGLHSSTFVQPSTSSDPEGEMYTLGEHVITAWFDQKYSWELGIYNIKLSGVFVCYFVCLVFSASGINAHKHVVTD